MANTVLFRQNRFNNAARVQRTTHIHTQAHATRTNC